MENNTSAAEGAICLYASKPCTNPRAVKRNGQLHQFCEFHRSKANFSQRRLDQKRQLEQELARLNQSADTTSQSEDSHVQRIEAVLADEIKLSDDEIRVLLELVSAYRPQ
ncbi:hypothetical protein V7S43_004500 [Phytophthora oleae]|uniref:Uncharacterized protein n=1 Tax=Phytophthora oleae TaxID=2107226 RepID=A0ABD3FTD4_9STRA